MKRIQRKRTKGWRMPEGAVYVGRPSVWGNPYWMPGVRAGRQDGIVFAPVEDGLPPIDTRHDAVRHFRWYVGQQPADWVDPLRGHDLACWCSLDQPCHADVLLELANA